MTKKKIVKKKLEVVPEQRTHLTEAEMLKIENHNLKVEVLMYKQALIESRDKLKTIVVEKEKLEIQNEKIKAEKERKEYNENIKKEFDLASETWGYDPLTGEVQ